MNKTIIELLDDYFVEVDELNHTLKKRYIGTDKNGDNKDAEKVIGYYKSVQDCLERIVRLIPLDENEGAVISLREYAEAAEKAFERPRNGEGKRMTIEEAITIKAVMI